ncbi:hypothetical protein TWF481_010163 [Arthrobotrys musiformis]|uniref:Uncharacterized protein n=1 Tax=Arthrobotrys musiformis TaxID=47236 RepID=A0AAV9W217_9PEZI
MAMELRLIIPANPAPGRYEIETSIPKLSSPRYRSKEVVSSISNPEYRTTPYDRFEITIKERSTSSRKHGTHRSPTGNLTPSKSTPNLRRTLTLETAPLPPPPPPGRYEQYRQRPSPSTNSTTSNVNSTFGSPWSNPSSSVTDISPLTPDNGQLFFLPSFQERDAGLAIEFKPMETQTPREHFVPPERLSSRQDTAIYELEDTSKRIDSAIDQLSPVSLLEKPLPLLPCPRSLERKINRSEPHPPPNKLQKQHPSNSQLRSEFRSVSMRSDRKPYPAGYAAPQAYSHKSSAQSTHTPVSRAKDSRPNTGHSKISFRQLQPDIQFLQPQHRAEQPQNQKKNKPKKPAFSIHLGRLHLVFGSTKQELADSRRNAGMYRGFESSKSPYCQDSRGRIQHT